jgi:hypothetical protein
MDIEPKRSERIPPEWLSSEARKVWLRTALQSPNADPDALTVYACAVADFQSAQSMLDKTGPVVQGAKGIVRNPAHMIKQANAVAIRALARDLHLFDNEAPAVPAVKRHYRNQRSVERTIAALRSLGRIEPVDEAVLALTRTISSAMDRIEPEESPAALASLARVQLQALKLLRGHDDDNDALATLLASLSSAVGDAEDA